MIFEFDPAKSVSNREKHGIDFVAAQALWDDVNLVEAPARDLDAPRFLAIGTIGGRHWAAIFARRGDAIRIISARRARDREIEHYESQGIR